MSEWGPWIEHDGKGCPLHPGVYVMVCFEWPTMKGKQKIQEGPLTQARCASENWLWPRRSEWGHPCVVAKYRIRKPKGLTILEGLLENLPKEVEIVE